MKTTRKQKVLGIMVMLFTCYFMFKVGQYDGVKLGMKYKESLIFTDDWIQMSKSDDLLEKGEYAESLDALMEGISKHHTDEVLLTSFAHYYSRIGDACAAVPWYKLGIKKRIETSTTGETYISRLKKQFRDNFAKCEAMKTQINTAGINSSIEY